MSSTQSPIGNTVIGYTLQMFKDFCGFRIASAERRLVLGIEIVLSNLVYYFVHRRMQSVVWRNLTSLNRELNTGVRHGLMGSVVYSLPQQKTFEHNIVS